MELDLNDKFNSKVSLIKYFFLGFVLGCSYLFSPLMITITLKMFIFLSDLQLSPRSFVLRNELKLKVALKNTSVFNQFKV